MLTLSPCSDFVRHELQRGFQGAVYSDVAEFGRFATALAGELDGGGGLPLSIPAPPPPSMSLAWGRQHQKSGKRLRGWG